MSANRLQVYLTKESTGKQLGSNTHYTKLS